LGAAAAIKFHEAANKEAAVVSDRAGLADADVMADVMFEPGRHPHLLQPSTSP
jgi:hypothetical protein